MIDAVMIGFDLFTWKLLFRNNIRVVKAYEAEEDMKAIRGWQAVGNVCQFEEFNIELITERSVLPHYFARHTPYRETDLLLGNAVIDRSVFVGENVFTWPGVVVAPFCVLEGDVEIMTGCHIGSHSVIGSGSRIHQGVRIEPGVILGSGCTIEADAYLTAGNSLLPGMVITSGSRY